MNRHVSAALAIALLFAAFSGRASADLIVVNGTFDQPLAIGWTIGGDADTAPDASGDPFAVFGENTAAGFSGISQDVLLNPLASTLVFDYALTTAGNFTGGALRDAFTLRLLNPATGDPLLATQGRNDVLYHEVPGIADPLNPDAGLILFDPALVTRDPVTGNPNRAAWRTVTVDITSLAGQPVRLEFGLLRGANGQSSVAGLDNVIPEPSGCLLLLLALALGRRRT